MADVTLVDGFELKIEVDGAPGPPVRLKCRHLTGPERHKIMHMEVQSGSGDPRVTQTRDRGLPIRRGRYHDRATVQRSGDSRAIV